MIGIERTMSLYQTALVTILGGLVVVCVGARDPYVNIDMSIDSPVTLMPHEVGAPRHEIQVFMGQSKEIGLEIRFNKDKLVGLKRFQGLSIIVQVKTLAPQYDVIRVRAGGRNEWKFDREFLEKNNYSKNSIIFGLETTYIGHAVLNITTELINDNKIDIDEQRFVHVVITNDNKTWNLVFVVLVSIFMVASYINIGAQLDEENISRIVNKPKPIILGLLISILVMPGLAWLVAKHFLADQPIYRVGVFVFATSPAASASTLWTVMLNSDKELSVGLQVASTLGALVSMPALLYAMEQGLQQDSRSSYLVGVPYQRLLQTIVTLIGALLLGWWLAGRNEQIKKVSQKIYRTLIFTMLAFIIVFSSILYWYIYLLFDWTISLVSLLVAASTCLLSALLGYLIGFNLDHAIPIAIGSTYKNSGIAFAVLLVAFEGGPEAYIAFVPGLTQVLTTSLTLYAIYSIKLIVVAVKRRHQPIDTIQAQVSDADPESPAPALKPIEAEQADDSAPDECIPMDITEVDTNSSPKSAH